MISCTDKTNYSSLDFLTNASIDNCYLFKKANDQEAQLLGKSIVQTINNIAGKFSIKGYVAVTNNDQAEILTSSLGVAAGGFLFITDTFVLMVWVEGVSEIRYSKTHQLNAAITSILPTSYLSTPVSKVMGTCPTGVAFLDGLVLESYDPTIKPTGMLSCDRAILNNGEPVAYFGCVAGNLPYEPIASGVVGARCALLKGSKMFNRAFKKYKSTEGVFLSATMRGQVSEIYSRLSSGLTVDLSCIKIAHAPVSLSYTVSASLGLLEKAKEFNESDSYFYYGSNLSNAIFLINDNNPILSDGLLSDSSSLGNIQERYEAVIAEVKQKLTKALAIESNLIFDQCASIVKELSFSGDAKITFDVNNFTFETTAEFPKIPLADVPSFSKVNEESATLVDDLRNMIDKNKSGVDRIRKNDGSFVTRDDIQKFGRECAVERLNSKVQDFFNELTAGLLESQNLVFERDVYHHDKRCDGTHYRKIPSVGHNEVVEAVLANSSVFAGLMSNHLINKNGVIYNVDALAKEEYFKDAFNVKSVALDKLSTGYQVSINIRLNVLQACSPLYTLDRQIKLNKDMLKQALNVSYPSAKVTFMGVEEPTLPTTTKRIKCGECDHTHDTFTALTCSEFAKPAYVMNFKISFNFDFKAASFADLPVVGDLQSWYQDRQSAVNTAALNAGSEWLAAEIIKLNLTNGLRFTGRIAGVYSSFKNMRLFVSADIANVVLTTTNLVYNVCYMKDENGQFVLNESNRKELLDTIGKLITDAELGGVYISFDSTINKYLITRVEPLTAAWYCDSTCQVSFSKKDLNLFPIYLSV